MICFFVFSNVDECTIMISLWSITNPLIRVHVFQLQVGACRALPTASASTRAFRCSAMPSSAGPSDGPKPPQFPPPAHFAGGGPKPSQAPTPSKAVSLQQWLAEAELMGKPIATCKSRCPHFAFEDDPAQPWTFPKSAVWGGQAGKSGRPHVWKRNTGARSSDCCRTMQSCTKQP